MRNRILLVASFAAVALPLASCGNGDGDAADSADGVAVVATEFEFEPAEVTIPADTPVDITLDNQGAVEHDWTIDELDILIYADAGESTTESITVAAGTYDVYCTIPGHRESGMEGVLTVTG